MQARHPALTAIVLAGLVLAGCSDGATESPEPTGAPTTTTPSDDTTSPSPPAETAISPPADPTDEPTDDATAAAVPELTETCELRSSEAAAERVRFAFPRGWQVESGNCEFFDPALEELPDASEPSAAISVRIANQDFAKVNETEEIEGEVRHIGARSGYQAVRIRGGSAGQALREDAEPVQLWLVDLDAGTDETGGALVLSAHRSDGAAFDLAAQAADRIAQTIQVDPVAAPDAPVVVTRTEGDGTPWTVTWDRDTECMQLRRGGPTDDVADEACDLAAPDGGISGAVLTAGDLEIVAGLAPPLAILAESDAATASYGAVTTPVEGASLFAYDANLTPLEVRAVDASGETLASTTIG